MRSRLRVYLRACGGTNVHPDTLVGQLQYRGEILYPHSRDLLITVRDMMLLATETDGWDRPPAGNQQVGDPPPVGV